MLTLQRVLVSVAMLALAIFVFIINGSVRTLQTTVQGHTTSLDKPVLDIAVFPGVPVAFTDRWNKATHGTVPAPQDYLWLTLYLTNSGPSQVHSIAADFVLTPTISAIYAGETVTRTPTVATASTGQTRATFSFLSLAPGNTHTAFIALRPDGLAGPPFERLAQHQWMGQHRAYWEHFTVKAGEHITFVQYGFASPMPVQQAASGPADLSLPPATPLSAARSAP